MKNRLEDVKSYEIFDTLPDKELDDITELASIICGTPISLITILDDKRQWFKSNKGLEVSETKVEDSFCQHALEKPNDVLVVSDALKDQRFRENKLVLGYPNIRFYAGAPLITKNNNVLGTLCIIDRKPRKIRKEQKQGLQILAKQVMAFLENQKILKSLNASVKLSVEKLVKITENVPIGIFELAIDQKGRLKILFLSKGSKIINPNINVRELIKNADVFFALLHSDDVKATKEALAYSVKNEGMLYHEYRVKSDSEYDWHAISGKVYKTKDGGAVIYGSITNVTHHHEYRSTLEQIAFDISHILRRPVTSLLGIMDLINSEQKVSYKKLKEYYQYIKMVAEELDEYTRRLNEIYYEKKLKIEKHNKK